MAAEEARVTAAGSGKGQGRSWAKHWAVRATALTPTLNALCRQLPPRQQELDTKSSRKTWAPGPWSEALGLLRPPSSAQVSGGSLRPALGKTGALSSPAGELTATSMPSQLRVLVLGPRLRSYFRSDFKLLQFAGLYQGPCLPFLSGLHYEYAEQSPWILKTFKMTHPFCTSPSQNTNTSKFISP